MSKAISIERKVELLKLACQDYKAHLEASIEKLAKELPEDVLAAYEEKKEKEQKKYPSLTTALLGGPFSNGLSIYWADTSTTEKYGITGEDVNAAVVQEKHPALYEGLRKYRIVTEMEQALNSSKGAEEKINDMLALRSKRYGSGETYADILKKHRGLPAEDRFLETILNIVTLGIYSKVTKGTFAFWKSHGQAMLEQVQEIGDKPVEKTAAKDEQVIRESSPTPTLKH
ncbi:hypothetical protein [Legionella septentrionalis]|uniref:hypothetical protein n=1 Tax=Legionella septentrionalis TaxID=2498109 RepID=UPI000F8D49DE|nr:hypothetical protein [Legionella septentrionalis]RUQ99550.1 hypothetical protein ELY11_04310 [Legionella septentrionalis]RUR11112.1 hypothetical protein ELY14_03330 [Legionella septentrionalis]